MSDVAAGAEHSALPQDTPHTQGGSQQGEELQCNWVWGKKRKLWLAQCSGQVVNFNLESGQPQVYFQSEFVLW